MFKLNLLISALVLAGASTTAAAIEWQALPSKAPEPADNPSTPAKVELGKMLYHDPRLSSSGTVSCNSCHNVMGGGDDNRGGSVGVRGQVGGRSAPTVWNAAFNSVQFWDGRAPSLEAQAKGPVTNPIEMGMKSWDDVVARLKAIPGYVQAFSAAFGGNDSITADNAAKAIAAYERTLITPNSAYDKYVNGDKNAMTEQQVRGMNTFAEVGCVSCHSGPAFNGPQQPEGTGFFMKFPTYQNGYLEAQYNFSKDLGRYDVTKNEADKHMFKVPTLRNVALTAPYFHNGKVKTLEDAVKIMAKLQLNKDLTKEQTDDIVAFLNALTGEFPKQEMPRLPSYADKTFDFE
ncbi:cytochrome-c peroxidase [Methylocaldum szegediense]|uniref:Cytochrome c551 peroxidase n=1 Tax=Methylocaldum szegediense TaxID=73780 RepID=A0ABN8X6Y5_9GAMM|nr:cytochrome-c peroxidase [Methylocaldum szegediense]CAI8915903.1 Cytochrome c551 peroxidase [Methylocaldum szegediense]